MLTYYFSVRQLFTQKKLGKKVDKNGERARMGRDRSTTVEKLVTMYNDASLVPDDLQTAVDAYAQEHGKPVSQVVADALSALLSRSEADARRRKIMSQQQERLKRRWEQQEWDAKNIDPSTVAVLDIEPIGLQPNTPARRAVNLLQALLRAESDDAHLTAQQEARGKGHRVTTEWMGMSVETLEDLLRPGLQAVVVGINPAPTSVKAGHYWQGKLGKKLWERLRYVGLFPATHEGFEDDIAFEKGVGFTDIVKTPTTSAREVSGKEMKHGLSELQGKLDKVAAPLVIFVFKKVATAVLGPFEGGGFVGKKLGPAEVFVMPGPYKQKERANEVLNTLRLWLMDRVPLSPGRERNNPPSAESTRRNMIHLKNAFDKTRADLLAVRAEEKFIREVVSKVQNYMDLVDSRTDRR